MCPVYQIMLLLLAKNNQLICIMKAITYILRPTNSLKTEIPYQQHTLTLIHLKTSIMSILVLSQITNCSHNLLLEPITLLAHIKQSELFNTYERYNS